VRLVWGPGGEGLFPDGVYFVDLAPIRDPALVASTIAETLGLKETGTQPLVQQLRTYLRGKMVLLLLDNFEQVLDAALLVAELLTDAPALKILVTSRELLHLRGEHECAVPPLALPDRAHLPPLERLTQYAAVQLFIARAQAAKSDFAVTNATAPAVAEICAQVDGLPLAIELAAARIKLFSPEALLARLGQRLPFLTGGPRDLPARQQTLRNTIDWSYALLDAAEQPLFRRLAVFVGGCTLEAAEAITTLNVETFERSNVLDGMTSLVDKSLLRQEEGPDGAPRFTLLETIREYALEQLAASGELEPIRQRHATYFVSLAEAGLPYDRQELEFPNFRAALEWSRTQADSATGLRLVLALDWRHSVSEARLWLADTLAQPAGGASWPDTAAFRLLRARALNMLGSIASWQDDLAAAQPAIEESLALFHELEETWSIADTASSLGRVVLLRGDYERSGALLEEGLTLFRQLEDSVGINECFFYMGNLAYAQGNLRRASECWQESLNLARQREHWQESLNEGQHEQSWMVAISVLHLGIVALDQGDDARAGAYLAESLTRLRELDDRWLVVHALEICAGLAVARGAGQRAARLFGADEALRETLGLGILRIWSDHYHRGVAAARALLGDAAFAAAWAEGRAMTLEQAIAYALSEGD
jgi:predicted ATPase